MSSSVPSTAPSSVPLHVSSYSLPPCSNQKEAQEAANEALLGLCRKIPEALKRGGREAEMMERLFVNRHSDMLTTISGCDDATILRQILLSLHDCVNPLLANIKTHASYRLNQLTKEPS
jgi:hypothetical protein